MKILLMLTFIALAFLSCSRDWNSPLENDSDLLHQPQILSIEQYNQGFKLQLNYSYSSEAIMLFERKITGAAYEPITMKQFSTSVFADTTLDMEFDHDLTYRIKVQKGEYYTDYSNEKAYNYSSIILNAPNGFTATTIEMQGVRLNWQDNSGKETGYKVEKNLNGTGYAEIANIPANSVTYMDNIAGVPATPLNLIYRVKAYTNSLNATSEEQNVIYSGLGAPTNLTITDNTFFHFTIAWTRNSTIANSYQIERKKNSGAYALLATVGAGVSTYSDNITEIGTYSYRVRANAGTNYSSYTNEAVSQITNELPNILPAIIDFTPIGKFNGHWYYTSTETATWQNAKIACANIAGGNGHLVTITSAEENEFMLVSEGAYWIGCTDEAVEGIWVWITGEPFIYTNWANGEPNNNGIGEDYGEMFGSNSTPSRTWNDGGEPQNQTLVHQYFLEIEPLSSVK
jgi:hypothetical protein